MDGGREICFPLCVDSLESNVNKVLKCIKSGVTVNLVLK